MLNLLMLIKRSHGICDPDSFNINNKYAVTFFNTANGDIGFLYGCEVLL